MEDNKTCPFCGSNRIEVYAHYGESAGIQYGGYYPECTVWHCKFTKRGLLYLDKTFFDWQESGDYLLQFLLTGKAVIIDDK